MYVTFGTLPQYGMDYWPVDARIIQVDTDPRMLGLVKTISVGINGDARAAAAALVERLKGRELGCAANRSERRARIGAEKAAWEQELTEWTHEKDSFSLEVAKDSKYMHPRQMLRELEKAMPEHAMVSTDIGNICSVSNSYLRFDVPRSMFAAMSFGNCGYAFPVICGAKLASRGRPAIAYVGDGAQHTCAELLLELESARSIAHWACWVAAHGGGDVALAASLAKSIADDTFLRAAEDNIHIHGGIGVTWEATPHLYYKRARSNSLLLDPPHWHRQRIAALQGF